MLGDLYVNGVYKAKYDSFLLGNIWVKIEVKGWQHVGLWISEESHALSCVWHTQGWYQH